MPSLPFPLRVAAGLLATGVESARRLPQDLPGLAVRAVGTVTKLALQVRTELTELAVRGDEVLAGQQPAQEKPSWAQFDEDEPAPRTTAARPAGAPAATTARTAARRTAAGTAGGAAAGADAVLPGYRELTLAQVRGHLRRLDAAAVTILLEAERSGDGRPAFLTLLGNRLATLAREA